MRAWVLLLGLAACGDNHAAVDAPVVADAPRRAVDAPGPPRDAPVDAVHHPDTSPVPGRPDLQVMGAFMEHSLLVTEDSFGAADCEVAEACVGRTGLRRLLRFDAVIGNTGEGDLVLGPVPPPGVSDATFTWSPCHMHHHVNGFAAYTLSDASGAVVTGRKNAFCLMDSVAIVTNAHSDQYTCDFQGISVGWADSYTRYLPCQWLDITDVPAGTYTLTVAVNPNGTIVETDTTNNTWSTPVTF